MDRLASITAFVRVAENGGFSAAARSLNVSATTISDQVQALENALGARLFNRTTRRVILTEVGREYYDRCAAMLVEESRILQVSIFRTLQDNLSSVDFSQVLLNVMAIADEVDSQLKQAMLSFVGPEPGSALPTAA